MRLFGTSGCFRFTVRFFYIFFFFFFIIISIRKTDKQLQLIFCYESTEMMDSRIESRYFLFFLQFDNIELEEIRTILFFFSRSFRSINFPKRIDAKGIEKKRRSVSLDELFERQGSFPRRFRGGEKPSIDFSTVLDRALVFRLRHGAACCGVYALTRFTVRWIARENGWGNKTKENGIRVGERNAPSHV